LPAFDGSAAGRPRFRSAGTMPQQAGWQEDEGLEEFEHPADRETDQAEREQEQPDERIEDQSDHGNGPAQDEEDAPEQELQHDGSFGEEAIRFLRRGARSVAFPRVFREYNMQLFFRRIIVLSTYT